MASGISDDSINNLEAQLLLPITYVSRCEVYIFLRVLHCSFKHRDITEKPEHTLN